jgi:hypothetical protein
LQHAAGRARGDRCYGCRYSTGHIGIWCGDCRWARLIHRDFCAAALPSALRAQRVPRQQRMTRVLVRRMAALAVCVAQLAVAGAAASDGLHHDASPHVERGGTQLHYAHNEATCVACLAQSLHARVEAASPSLPPVLATLAAPAPRMAAAPSSSRHSPTAPRAPPPRPQR